MRQTVARFMLDRLKGWGVRRVFGYPGDGSNGLDLAFHDSALEFVQVRHEELAALAACGHAKLTGELGVCLATSGPGAIHLLNGLYDAKLDRAPVLAIVGQQRRMSLGSDYQQEVDLAALFKDVASRFVQVCMTPEQAPHLIDRAVRTALGERTVTALIVPADVQELDAAEPPREHGAVFSSPAPARPPVVRPPDDELRRAAALLNAGERVAMLVGQGARGATDEALAVADALGAGIAKALNGLAVVPDDVPFVTGSVGLIGTRASARMMSGCDTLLLAGTGFPYAEWLPVPGAARAVQIDIDPSRLGTRYPTEVNLVGDAAETLRALLPLLRRRDPDAPWRRRIAEDVDRWRAQLAAEAEASADPVNPQQVFEALAARLPDNAILLADSGSATAWWARHLRIRRGMDAALSGTLATMCPAVPYALAARLAHPTRPVIATTGDGAMQMLGINGLIDLARHVPDGAAATVVLVVNNGDLNLVSWEQRAMAGEPKLDASQDLAPFDHAAFAGQIGLEGIRVERPDDVGPALDRALAARRPAVVDVVCDPEVPPLPPEIRADEAKGFAKAVVKGDSGARHMVEQAVKGAIRDLGTRS